MPPGLRSERTRRGAVGRWFRRAAAFVVALVLLGVAYYVALFVYAENSVDRRDVLRPVGPEILSPERQVEAQNFLVVGRDVGDRDTTMLAHLSADRSRAVVVVFPGQALVDVPPCTGPDGSGTEPFTGAFGRVLQTGGADCLVRTVQALTGLRINHYVQIAISGVPAMVDAVGGVPLCLTGPVRDAGAGLSLPAGASTLSGAQALPFLRSRAESGAAEVARIQRQQQFLASLLDRALAASTLANPVRVTRFVSASVQSVTLDPDTTFRDLRSLVGVLQDISGTSVVFVTAPVAQADYRPAGSAQSFTLLDEELGARLYRSVIDESTLVLPQGGAALNRTATPAVGGCR